MLSRFAFTFVVASTIAIPAFAESGHEKLKTQVSSVVMGWKDAFNKADVKASVGFWTQNGIEINGSGMVAGEQALTERMQKETGLGLVLDMSVDNVESVGHDGAIAAGKYTVTVPGKDGTKQQIPGLWINTLEKHGKDWKIISGSFTRLSTPPPTAAPTQSK